MRESYVSNIKRPYWAQYHSDYDWRKKGLQDVSQPTLHQTPFASPQLEMFELDDEQWLKVRQRSYQRQRKRIAQRARQLPLKDLEIAV